MRPPLHLSRSTRDQLRGFLRACHRTLEEGDRTFRVAGAYACIRIVISLISLSFNTDVLGTSCFIRSGRQVAHKRSESFRRFTW
jgi:hypothetical protein